MAVPKRKTSKSKRNMRRAHHALGKHNIAFDPTTGEAKLSHHISLKDGLYKGNVVIAPKMKASAAETNE